MGSSPSESLPAAAAPPAGVALPGGQGPTIRRIFLAQWMIVGLALLAIGSIITHHLREQRQYIESIAQDRLSLGARSIAVQLERRLASINIALIDLKTSLPYLRAQANGETLVAMSLHAFHNAVDGVRTVMIIDAQGRCTAATRPQLVGQSVAERDYFQTVRRAPLAQKLYIAVPFKTMLGAYSSNLAKATFDSRGEFSGIVSATLDPEDLQRILTSLRYTPDVSAGLIHGSGKALIYLSSDEIAPGTELSDPNSFFSRHLRSGQQHSLFSGFTALLPDEQLAAVHTIDPSALSMNAPLVVVVSQDLAGILAPWRSDVRAQASLFVLLALLSSTALFIYQRRQRKLARLIDQHQTERQQSADRLKLASEASNTGIWELDLKSDALIWDDTMFRLYGQARESFSHDYAAWRQSVLPEDRPDTETMFRQAVDQGQEFGTLFRIRRGDGEVRIIDARAWVYRDAQGQPARMIGVNRDITERQRIEQSLRESKDFTVSILHSLVQHIAVLDAQGVIVTVNQAWQDFARDNGASAQTLESVGLNYLEICSAAPDRGCAAEVLDVLAAIRAVLDGTRAEFSHEYACHSPDQERWFIMHVTPLRGSVLGAVVAHENITPRKLAERAVRESEERFSAFFEHAMVGMATTSLEKGWIQVNPALCAILGYPREELIRTTWTELTHPDDLAADVASFDRLRRDEADDYAMEKRFIHPDGAIVHAFIAVRAVRRGDRSIAFFAAIVEDISERKAAEEASHRALMIMQQFLDHLPGTAYVKDEKLRVLMANKAFQTLLGLDPAEVIGKSNRDLFPGDFGKKLDADDKEVLKSGQRTVIEEDFEGRFFESSKFVIVGEAGERLLGGITREVTQRQKSFERQKALLKIGELGGTLPEKTFLTEGLKMVERLTGSQIGWLHFVADDQQSVELVAWTDGALMSGTAAAERRIALDQAGLWGDCARDRKIALVNDQPGDGARKDWPPGQVPRRRLVVVPVVEDDKVRLVLGVGNKSSDYDEFDCATVQLLGNDLWRIIRRARVETELQQNLAELTLLYARLDETNNKLLQSEKLASIGQLAAGVAHEINNPIGYVSSNLNSLTGYVKDLLAIDAAYGEIEERFGGSLPHAFERARQIKSEADYGFMVGDIHHLLDESREGLERVRKIVHDLKDFSRVGETGWQRVDLHAGLESTLNIVWNEIKYKAEVERDYGELPAIHCIPSQINQVFMNLLTNAAQAIEAHGHIVLRSRREGATAWIEVQDDGVGIAPENLERIFEPFYTTKDVGKGTGLGLSLSWAIVQRHHGRIEVRPAPGRGTIFRVILPINSADPLERTSGTPTPIEAET